MYTLHNPCFDLHHLSPIRTSSNPVHNFFNALKCSWFSSTSCSYNKFDTSLTGLFTSSPRFTLSWWMLVITANITPIVSLSSAYTFPSSVFTFCTCISTLFTSSLFNNMWHYFLILLLVVLVNLYSSYLELM
ncbi:hypothetical protein C8J55DRAFT_529296 [Lentinula edodes]|uniref:Uncharacterized protein n=1 Tax=Lentinula lateritia TaxID=40482 RepID=A0A9W8ZRH7_9AGAR|nr:hypothetical protein C8J55DRAFT_529296 [Lentinula edodes]